MKPGNRGLSETAGLATCILADLNSRLNIHTVPMGSFTSQYKAIGSRRYPYRFVDVRRSQTRVTQYKHHPTKWVHTSMRVDLCSHDRDLITTSQFH